VNPWCRICRPSLARNRYARRARRRAETHRAWRAAIEVAHGRTYGERIDGARTEKDLSDIFEDFIAAVRWPHLFEEKNPSEPRADAGQRCVRRTICGRVRILIRSRQCRRRAVYAPRKPLFRDRPPAPVLGALRSISLSLATSTQANMQAATPHFRTRSARRRHQSHPRRRIDAHGAGSKDPGAPNSRRGSGAPAQPERERNTFRARAGQEPDFERSALYLRTFSLAEQTAKEPLPRALVPRIELHSPKIRRHLTTDCTLAESMAFSAVLARTSAQP